MVELEWLRFTTGAVYKEGKFFHEIKSTFTLAIFVSENCKVFCFYVCFFHFSNSFNKSCHIMSSHIVSYHIKIISYVFTCDKFLFFKLCCLTLIRCRESNLYISVPVAQGQWKDGMRDGVGQQTWPDGACYSGQCATWVFTVGNSNCHFLGDNYSFLRLSGQDVRWFMFFLMVRLLFKHKCQQLKTETAEINVTQRSVTRWIQMLI